MPLFFQTPPVCLSSLWCPGVVQEHCQNIVRPLSAMVTISSGTGTFFLNTLNSTVSVTTLRTGSCYSISVTLHDCQKTHTVFLAMILSPEIFVGYDGDDDKVDTSEWQWWCW